MSLASTSRTNILKLHFNTTFLNDVTYIDCQCNVSYIFEKLLVDFIYSADQQETCTNVECRTNNVKRKCAFIPININDDINSLNKTAESMLNIDNNMTLCRRNDCNGIKSFNHTLKDAIFFEFSQNTPICIHEIPVNIILNQMEYTLMSVIEFLEPTQLKGMGHYRAHCYRSSGWECYDDLATRVLKSNRNIVPHCIMYGIKN